MFKLQVEKSHYSFEKYISKKRWMSIWQQIDEVLKLSPENILEIGVGSGILKTILCNYGFDVETVDIDPDLNPDYVTSAISLPLKDESYSCVCCFQVLEHLEYSCALDAFREIVRVSRKNIIISLPDARILYSQSLSIPRFGDYSFFVPKPILKKKENRFNGEHYWEINKKGYELQRVLNDLTKINRKGKLIRTYRVKENPYHRFFVFDK